MKQLLSLVFAAFLMTACNSSSENSGTTNTTAPSEQINADSEKPTVNPAHGQPYHDCSIPVGAPLAAK